MRGPAQIASQLAVALVIVGFALIGLAWNGAADFDTIQQQFPYLLSGGLTGLGFIIGGMALMVVQVQRQLTAERARQMRRLNGAFARLGELVSDDEALAEARELVVTGAPAAAEAPTEALPAAAARTGTPRRRSTADTGPMVVVGRSSFHDPACHLVSGREDLDQVPRQTAVESDLAPCRICKP